MSLLDSKKDDFDTAVNQAQYKVLPTAPAIHTTPTRHRQQQTRSTQSQNEVLDQKYDDQITQTMAKPPHLVIPPDSTTTALPSDFDIISLHSRSLEDRYESILKNQIDHPTVLFSSKSQERGSRHLLELLTALSTLLPQHLPTTYTPPISGELNFLDTNPYMLDSLSHDIRSTYYTNTVPTRHQLNLTRHSGSVPHLEPSNGLINGLMVAVGTSHPEALHPSQINRANLSHPINSTFITLSDLDIVPIVVDNVAKTTTTTTVVDPRTAQNKKETVTTTQKLPSSIEYARGTSIERIFETRNSGMIPSLAPSGPTASHLSTEFVQSVNSRSSLPRLVISNPISSQRVDLGTTQQNGQQMGSQVQLNLTQAELDSMTKWICIQRNRNMGRISPARLSAMILENAGQQVIDVVREEQTRTFHDQLKRIDRKEKDELTLLDRLYKEKCAESDLAYKDKQAVLQSALNDYNLQLSEAEKRLKHSSSQVSSLSTAHYNQLISARDTLEKEIDKLERDFTAYKNDYARTNGASTDTLNKLEIDYNKQYSNILNTFTAKCNELKDSFEHSVKTLPRPMDESVYRSKINELQSQREDLLSSYKLTVSRLDDAANKQATYLKQLADLEGERARLWSDRENALLRANDDISKLYDDWFNKYNDVTRRLQAHESNLSNLRTQHDALKQQTEQLFSQDELRLRGVGIELEHCYLLPQHEEIITKTVPKQVITTEQIVIEQPIVRKELHYEIQLDPALTTTTTTTTTRDRRGNILEQTNTTPVTLTSDKPLASLADPLPQSITSHLLTAVQNFFTTFNNIRQSSHSSTSSDNSFDSTFFNYDSCISVETDDEGDNHVSDCALTDDVSHSSFSGDYSE